MHAIYYISNTGDRKMAIPKKKFRQRRTVVVLMGLFYDLGRIFTMTCNCEFIHIDIVMKRAILMGWLFGLFLFEAKYAGKLVRCSLG